MKPGDTIRIVDTTSTYFVDRNGRIKQELEETESFEKEPFLGKLDSGGKRRRTAEMVAINWDDLPS